MQTNTIFECWTWDCTDDRCVFCRALIQRQASTSSLAVSSHLRIAVSNVYCYSSSGTWGQLFTKKHIALLWMVGFPQLWLVLFDSCCFRDLFRHHSETVYTSPFIVLLDCGGISIPLTLQWYFWGPWSLLSQSVVTNLSEFAPIVN